MRMARLYSQMSQEDREHYDELLQLSIDIEEQFTKFKSKLEDLCKHYAYELAQDMYRDMVCDEGDDRK